MRLLDLDRWNEMWQTIARNKKRSVMTAFGVFWGVFMLVVLLSFGIGLGDLFSSNLGNMSSNSAFIFSSRTTIPYQGMPSGRWWSVKESDISNLRTLEGMKYVAPIFFGRDVQVSKGNIGGDYFIVGSHPEYQKIDPLGVLEGRCLNEIDEIKMRKMCVIGEDIKTALFKEESPIGQTIKVNNSYFVVVGVVKLINKVMDFGNTEETVFVSSSLFRQLYSYGDKVDAIAMTGNDDANINQIFAKAKKIVASNNMIDPKDSKAVTGFSFSEELKKINNMVSGVFVLTWIVGLGTLLAGIVGISNIMLVTVRDRTSEIGIRRALGAKPRDVVLQILSESFVLTFIAGVAGLTMAVALMSVVDPLIRNTLVGTGEIQGITLPSFQIDFWMGLACVGIIVFCSLLAGLIPAYRAIKVKAVDAIRYE